MKKIMKYFSFLLVLLIVVTGCGKDDKKEDEKLDKDLINELIANAQTIESLRSYVKMDMELEYGDNNVGFLIETDIMYDALKNYYMRIVNDESNLGIENIENIETYAFLQENDKYLVYAYEPSTGWYYDLIDEKSMPTVSSNEQITEFLHIVTETKEVESDKEGYDKYLFTVNLSKFSEIFDLTVAVGSEIKFSDDEIVDIETYVKDGNINILKIDLSELVTKYAKEMNNLDSIEVKFDFSVEYSDINQVETIKLPEEAKDAKTIEELIDSEM